MKKYLLWALLFFVKHSFAQNRDELAIRNSMSIQENSWNAGDMETFMSTYWNNDSLLMVGSNGPTYGWQNILARYKKAYPDTVVMGKLHFNILQVKALSKEYYFFLGKFFLSRSIGDLKGAFTLLFRKINGHWLIIADHSS